MGKRATLLEGLCGHALSFGADVLHVEHKNGHDLVYARNGKTVFRIAKYATNSSDAKELRNDLSFGIRKPLLRLLNGQRWILRVVAGSADRSVHVTIEPAPPLDPTAPPSFSAKQGQYLAFIYYYKQDQRNGSGRDRLPAPFRSHASSRTSDGGEPGPEWLHRPDTGAGPLHPFAGSTRVPAAAGIENRSRGSPHRRAMPASRN